MMKLAVAAALLVSAASLILAVVALREARDDGQAFADSQAEAGIGLDGLMTRRQVVMRLGLPDRVFRRNPRAECWAYEGGGSYEVRMCFGAKRRLAWHSYNIPPDESLLERLRQARKTEN
jgi:hypothetical protein